MIWLSLYFLLMKKNSQILFAIIALIFIQACKDDTTLQTGEPTDLTLEVNVSDDKSGIVDFIVQAVNAEQYQIDPGVGDDEIVINFNGLYTHTYAITGEYLIEARAIGSLGRYLKKTKEITVQVGEVAGPVTSDVGYTTPLSYEGMSLLWQDEFMGTTLNESDWNYEIGTGSNGWGNNELQYYRKENTSVSNGRLIIEAQQESFGGRSYTSSRLTTQDKFDFLYGRVDIRAVLPKGQGIWPALWMLGANFSSIGWPACGEIDIMEMIGGGANDSKVNGTVHWSDSGQLASYGGNYSLNSGIFNDEFHVFSIVWDQSSITWFLDDLQYHSIDTSPSELDEFRKNFFFIFNVAVGGNWPGSPNSSTVFPQRMVVDYVRVFQSQ